MVNASYQVPLAQTLLGQSILTQHHWNGLLLSQRCFLSYPCVFVPASLVHLCLHHPFPCLPSRSCWTPLLMLLHLVTPFSKLLFIPTAYDSSFDSSFYKYLLCSFLEAEIACFLNYYLLLSWTIHVCWMNEKLKFHKNPLSTYFMQKHYSECSRMTLFSKSKQASLKQTQGGDLRS
jgi:hypothetical protein